ncbi:MAG TPA: methyltransferase domain-containing protein [Polyangiaceae bacterium]|nr:methyltransferase domain-containing protein [Polyangiaceae bacterium]
MFDLRECRGKLRIPGLIVRCEGCSFWYKIPVRSDDIPESYQGDYGQDEAVERYMLGEQTRVFYRKVLAGLSARRGRLLDLGCGYGALLEEANRLGYDAQGIDLSNPLVLKARERGLNVECKSAEDLDEVGAFDVVTMLDIIEHVSDPLALLAAARRALKPGGELVVYTPNHRAAVVLLARTLYAAGLKFAVIEIFGGNHVGFFDDRTLPAAFRKAGLGPSRLALSPYDPTRPGQYVSPISLMTVAAVERVGQPFDRVFRMLAYTQV